MAMFFWVAEFFTIIFNRSQRGLSTTTLSWVCQPNPTVASIFDEKIDGLNFSTPVTEGGYLYYFSAWSEGLELLRTAATATQIRNNTHLCWRVGPLQLRKYYIVYN